MTGVAKLEDGMLGDLRIINSKLGNGTVANGSPDDTIMGDTGLGDTSLSDSPGDYRSVQECM